MIKGNGFVLRPIKMSDAERYLECYQGKNMKQCMLKFPETLTEAKEELKKKVSDFRKKRPFGQTFAIEVKGIFAGYIEIHHLNIEHHEHKGEIGYAIHPDFRGQGLATKAVKVLTKYAFEKHSLKRIDAWGRANNKASARVLEKVGYKLEGVLRKNKCVDGKYLDDFVYAKVR